MLKTDRVIIVEGKYDKIKLSSLIDAVIIETNGFAIFSDSKKLNLIRKLAKTKGLIILTDSDAAGFKIRSFIGGSVTADSIKHVYIPDIAGKERRKKAKSKEGKLGVEGVSSQILLDAFEKAGITCEKTESKSKKVTNLDLYEDGITGGKDSKILRKKLIKSLDLPEHLSKNSLLNMINIFMTYEEYKDAVKQIKSSL